MGGYNPHSPYVIGNEWVPIRQADYEPDDITEHGYSFLLEHAVTIVSGAYYTRSSPVSYTQGTSEFMSVYPEGLEDLTGPIKSVVVPVSAVMITGGSASYSGDINNPADSTGVFYSNGGTGDVGFSFNTTAFSQALFGKRILDVQLLYIATGEPASVAEVEVSLATLAFPSNNYLYSFVLEGPSTVYPTEIKSVSLTELNPFWNTAATSTSSPVVSSIYPWRYDDLARLDTTASSRLIYRIRAPLTNAPSGVTLHYLALKIIYCEERRVLYGGDFINGSNVYLPSGGKYIPLRVPSTHALPGSTAAGRYVVTHTNRNLTQWPLSGLPVMDAIRQLYELPQQQGRIVNYGTLDNDTEFTADSTDVLTQLTLHTATTVVTGSHPYGTVSKIPVYGTITAIQEIEDDPAGVSKQYPQVRFYARRFGSTTAPLRLIDVAAGTSSVTITPADFDALPEIVDGWKEVNLRFASPPSFATAAGDVDWRWDAAGEAAGNQWQVLGADGPSVTGTQVIGAATYYAPVGNTVDLTWQSPYISGTAADPFSDATLIFSTDPPAVTGFTLGTCTQAVTGFMDCGTPERCVPTGIYGNQINWNNGVICSAFTESVTGGWPAAETGQSWVVTEGSPSEFGSADGYGRISHSAANTSRVMLIPAVSPDMDVTALVYPGVIAASASIRMATILRRTDSGNYYMLQVFFENSGIINLTISAVVGGSGSTLASVALPVTYTGGTKLRTRFRAVGSTLQAKAWEDGTPEPAWDLTLTNSSLTAAGSVGFRTVPSAGNTNTYPLTLYVDDFQAVPATLGDGFYEIQRWDSVDGFWSTILDTANLCVTGFCDYEARVGVESIYRMRTRNMLDFEGPWVSGAATLPAPGVAGYSGNAVLIFTSNAAPTGNLAYVMQFENRPVEEFQFPEAADVDLERMYGKDYFTAFHPLERGGEQFSRNILTSAAAIPLPSLGNFHSLRDLAWAQLDYVCVRDELGNRWYANVLVPSASVRSNRRRYLAQIQVTQVTATPSPLDPS